jgi:hypothetical protein
MKRDEFGVPELQPRRYGVRRVLAALGRRLVAVDLAVRWSRFEPLNAALLDRQVGQAAKAETGLRTPNCRRLCSSMTIRDRLCRVSLLTSAPTRLFYE